MKWLAGIGVGLVIAVLTIYIGISEPVFDFIYGFFVPEPVPALICIFSLAIIAGIAGFVLTVRRIGKRTAAEEDSS